MGQIDIPLGNPRRRDFYLRIKDINVILTIALYWIGNRSKMWYTEEPKKCKATEGIVFWIVEGDEKTEMPISGPRFVFMFTSKHGLNRFKESPRISYEEYNKEEIGDIKSTKESFEYFESKMGIEDLITMVIEHIPITFTSRLNLSEK